MTTIPLELNVKNTQFQIQGHGEKDTQTHRKTLQLIVKYQMFKT